MVVVVRTVEDDCWTTLNDMMKVHLRRVTAAGDITVLKQTLRFIHSDFCTITETLRKIRFPE